MKYVFFSNQGLGPKHLGIELEVISGLKAIPQNQVISVSCDSVLNGCYFNPTKNPFGCAICEERTRNCAKDLAIDSRHSLEDIEVQFEIPKIYSLQELLALKYDGINIGIGVASSIISLKRDFEITTEKYGKIIQEICHTAIIALENFKKIIANIRPDGIYLFNGRFAETYPIIELCRSQNITYNTIEVASPGKYYIYKNSLPHSIKVKKGIMEQMWLDGYFETQKRIATEFFESKVRGNVKGRKNFINSQQKNLLPESFDKSKYNIVFFNSSEDEMKVIEEWQHNYYESQNQAILRIVRENERDSNVHFYLRVHPNLADINNKQISELQLLQEAPNLTIIDAKSDVDTYGILNACNMTITFGSTMGIEATYWGKPSLLIGRTFYEDTDSIYKAGSFEEINEYIAKRLDVPKPKVNTYKYAYYFSTYGIPFKDFRYEDKKNASFQNKKFKAVYITTILRLITYLPKIPKWFTLHRILTGHNIRIQQLLKLYNQISK
jgi:hypothetical protein